MPPKRKTHQVTMELAAGEAPVAELGKMLGPFGLNLREIMLRYNEATAGQRGDGVPVEVTVFEDRSYQLRFLAPSTAFLLRRAAGIEKGSAAAGKESAAVLDTAALRYVAKRKLPELNTDDLEVAVRIVAGTARSMGIRVED